MIVDRLAISTIDRNSDLARIGARANYEVIFQLPLIAVVDDIDARIDGGIANARKGLDVGKLLIRSAASKVVNLAREQITSSRSRIDAPVYESQMNGFRRLFL